MNKTFEEFQNAFFEETEEHLTILNENLIALDMDKKGKNGMNAVFRILHTLKSSAAAVGLHDLGKLAHTAEDLIQNARSGKLQLNERIMDLLFEVLDKTQQYITQLRDTKELDIDLEPLVKKIDKVNSERSRNKTKTKMDSKSGKLNHTFQLTIRDKTTIKKAEKEGKSCLALAFAIDYREKIKWLRVELVLNGLEEFSDIITTFPNKRLMTSDDFDGRFTVVVVSKEQASWIKQSVDIDLVKLSRISKVTDLEKPIPMAKKTEQKSSEDSDETNGDSLENQAIVSQTIRIPVKRLDHLLHLAGELAIINSGLKILENRLEDIPGLGEIHADMNHLSDDLNKISSDMQNGIMKARMIPVGSLFNQFKRIVRDLSRKENKEAELIIQGGDTELDKNVIDLMGDPLMHMVRNAVDHGIETSKVRQKKNKPARGVITLSASQSGNHIIISLQDDGRGIDIEKVKEIAVRSGLADRRYINEMNESEIIKFIFEPGFTTMEKVSAVSGRGVGLDVVKNGIAALNGSVQVRSEMGKGTEFCIILPLTLAMTTVVVVKRQVSLYGIPILDIDESIKIRREEIEDHECIKVLMHRDKVLPIIDLKDIFSGNKSIYKNDITLQSDDKSNDKVYDGGLIPVLIVRAMDEEVGILVDQIMGKEDVMLKPLEANYRSVNGISGAAVMGDGKIVLVIDTLKVLSQFADKKPVLEEVMNSDMNSGKVLKG